MTFIFKDSNTKKGGEKVLKKGVKKVLGFGLAKMKMEKGNF